MSGAAPDQRNPPETIEALAELCMQSGLQNGHEVQALKKAFQRECQPGISGESAVPVFARFLIDSGALTDWQCGMLRAGRWRGLFYEGYELLEHVESEGEESLFVARASRDAEPVTLAIKRNPNAPTRLSFRLV